MELLSLATAAFGTNDARLKRLGRISHDYRQMHAE
jgi:hypothetical protein